MRLIVDNMSCEHCVKTVTKAINRVDPTATVTVNLSTHEVDIEKGSISQQDAIAAIEAAGFQYMGTKSVE
ncbi:heavy-metal-associated domain-containing protein [Orbaceae bacterium ESL0721]|nr:heavy-metal-associated domain-containing protein [Orbaceae bacterium ESL0721]